MGMMTKFLPSRPGPEPAQTQSERATLLRQGSRTDPHYVAALPCTHKAQGPLRFSLHPHALWYQPWSQGSMGHSAQRGTFLPGHLSQFPGWVSARWEKKPPLSPGPGGPGPSYGGAMGRALADCLHYFTESSQWPQGRGQGHPHSSGKGATLRAAAPPPMATQVHQTQCVCSWPAAPPAPSRSQPHSHISPEPGT